LKIGGDTGEGFPHLARFNTGCAAALISLGRKPL
jgi:hypothetical protein